jgi:F0F1-type ATP synthase membrane subunit c/vacuolar-type H+-ATPase subunit K
MNKGLLVALGSILAVILNSSQAFAFQVLQVTTQQSNSFFGSAQSAKFIAAAIAFGFASVGAGYGIGKAGAAGLAATAERPEIRTFALIITALAEALAIYGLVIAIIILGNPTP